MSIGSILRRGAVPLYVLLTVAWSLGPIYWTAMTSISPASEVGSLGLWPRVLSVEHYAKLFGNTEQIGPAAAAAAQFGRAFLNSLVTSLAATVICVAVAALGGYAFVRIRFPGRDVLFLLIVATMAIPAYTVLIPLYRIMADLGQIDTFTGVSLIYVSGFLPLALWLMRSVYQSLPRSVEEAAKVDGASRLYTLYKIVLPLATPGLVAAAIVTFLQAWGSFMVPLVFSPTRYTKPLTVLIPEFATKNSVDYGLISASGVLAILPPVLVVVFLNRYLVQGLLAGAAK